MSLAASSWKDEFCVFNRDTTPKEKSEFSTALQSERRYGAANTIVRKLEANTYVLHSNAPFHSGVTNILILLLLTFMTA